MTSVAEPVAVEPFTIAVDDAVLSDLRDRIERTRWPDGMDATGWESGVDPEYLRSLLVYWAGEFDWREQERRLNRFKHYLAHVDGVRVHLVHERGSGANPLPIVLTHGFPSSFVEHLELLPLVTDPVAHGGQREDAFDVVVASLPGYGFSDPLPGPMLETTVADVWCRLMRDGLGYGRFGAQRRRLGRHDPARTTASRPADRHPPERLLPLPAARAVAVRRARVHGLRTPEERRGWRVLADAVHEAADGRLRLTDSPAGLAAWIVDQFRAFSDCGGDIESRFTRDQILTNLTIYWATGAIGPAMQGYYDFEQFETPPPPGTRVRVPAGSAVFADSYRPDSARTPRELAEHFFDIARWTVMPRGGHFAALEEPELLADDIRQFLPAIARRDVERAPWSGFPPQGWSVLPTAHRWFAIEITVASHSHPAGRRRKLPPVPGYPGNAKVEKCPAYAAGHPRTGTGTPEPS
jgi:pimeloyl-ACP methyl ester carboxylesterase